MQEGHVIHACDIKHTQQAKYITTTHIRLCVLCCVVLVCCSVCVVLCVCFTCNGIEHDIEFDTGPYLVTDGECTIVIVTGEEREEET